MAETLLTPSSIKLFGRVMGSLKLVNDTTAGPSHNNFLQEQLAAKDARLARIYSFSYEGAYYPLPRPRYFLFTGKERQSGIGRNRRRSTSPVSREEIGISRVLLIQQNQLFLTYSTGNMRRAISRCGSIPRPGRSNRSCWLRHCARAPTWPTAPARASEAVPASLGRASAGRASAAPV
jgi:hypothetical protein